jgi:anti-sigma factor RsiW
MKRWYDRRAMQKSDYINKFLDGDLSPEELPDLESDQMKATLESLKRMQDSLKNLPRVKTSDSFDAVLRARIRQEMRHTSRLQRFFSNGVGWRIAGYATAASLFIGLGIVLGKVMLTPAAYDPSSAQREGVQPVVYEPSETINNAPAESRPEQAVTNYVIEHVVSSEIEHLPRYTISSEGKREFEQVYRDSLKNRNSVRETDRPLIQQASSSVQF